MAKEKKEEAPAGAPAWMVTFADLMSLLVCFFVLIVSFSIQDDEKMQVVAGSMRDAFGVRDEVLKNGVVEFEGVPVRYFLKDVAIIDDERDTNFEETSVDHRSKQGPEANTHDIELSKIQRPKQFASAAASLRQAWQELPEVHKTSKNVIVQETEEGLNIMLVDQDGRSMFPEGSRYPYESTKALLKAAAPVLRKMPNRIRITGHTTAGNLPADPTYTEWELSADRANASRAILTEFGLKRDRFHSIIGKGASEPMFINDPYLASNRRIEILLMHEEPPLPTGHRL